MIGWIRKIRIEGKPHDLPHPFEDELEWLVRTNYNIVLRRVDELIAQASPEDEDYADYVCELKKAAIRLALVGLVTRLHHWVAALASDVTGKNTRDESLDLNLKRLNQCTGPGPVSLDFFKELVTVRDSIIHADSQVEWTFVYRGNTNQKRVADRYASSTLREIEFTQQHLDEAIDSAVKQVKWYHNKLLDAEAQKREAANG